MYAMNRKRKAERYAEALKRHRSRLLHIGVTQWIEVHTVQTLIKHTLVVCEYPVCFNMLVCYQYASSEGSLRTGTPDTGTWYTNMHATCSKVRV